MRRSIPLQLAVLLGISVLGGCSSGAGSATSDAALDARIQEALHQPGVSERNAQLQRVALDATDAGQVEQARRAIQEISLEPLRDDTARAAARRFHRKGEKDLATKMAALIGNPVMRAQVNAELAGQK